MKRRDHLKIPPFIDQFGRPTYNNPYGYYRPNPALNANLQSTANAQPEQRPEAVAGMHRERGGSTQSNVIATAQWRATARHRVHRPVAVLAIALASMVAAGAVFAYFTSHGSGAGAASTATLAAPTGVGTTYTSGTTTVQVNWTGVTPPGPGGTFGYYVQRFVGSTPSAACGTTPTSLTTNVTCNDTSVPDGTYTYKVTAVYNSWTATSSPSAPVVVVGKVTPTLTATGPANDTLNTPISAANIASVLSGGSTSPAVSGTITVAVFGPQTNAPTNCTGGTTVGTATVNGNGTDHPSAGYTPITTGNYWWYASYGGDSHNNAANSTCGSGMSETVVSNPIASAPGVTAAVTFGSNPLFVNNENLNLTDNPTDTGSTIQSVAYSYCAGASGACTNGTPIGSTTTSAGNTWPVTWTAPALADGPYRIVAAATDNAGNVSASSAATVVNVDTTPPTVSRPIVNGHP